MEQVPEPRPSQGGTSSQYLDLGGGQREPVLYPIAGFFNLTEKMEAPTPDEAGPSVGQIGLPR